jgi:hypothetical protein
MTEHPAIYSQDSAEPSEFPPTSYEQPTDKALLRIILSPVQSRRNLLERVLTKIFKS